MEAVILLGVLLGLLAAGCLLGGASLWRRRRRGGALGTFVAGLLFFLLALVAGLISVGTRGYRALTREDVAARVEVEPLAADSFLARFSFPDGATREFRLAGEELYVDARILKWRSVANLLGLHTEYELDRVAGRYASLADERSRPRTVYSLGREKPFDFFHIARRLPLLDPLVDAEYGSATFVGVERAGAFEVRVSTTGLLVRRVDGP